MDITQISKTQAFGGSHLQFEHHAKSLNCHMRFAIFLPPGATKTNKVPVLYWLSGLTCNDENFMQKAGALKLASELGIAIVAPDTSPRGDDVPDDIDGAWDFGLGAGFYLNATEQPWSKNYQMYDYVVNELPALIEDNFPVNDKRSISGHSMGGHGALVIALRNSSRYQSVSAFSPINHPTQCPWGLKAFSNYLGADEGQWQKYDATMLMLRTKVDEYRVPMLVDQGTADNFLAEQLKPQALIDAAAKTDYPLELRMQEGYDHSYYFISSFIDDHLKFHYLKLSNH